MPISVKDVPGIYHRSGAARALDEHLYLIDFIPINFNPRNIDRQKLRDLYLKRRLSSAQIGKQVGLSKQTVLSRLRKEGIQKTKNQGRDPKNFRYPYAAYGYQVIEGQLAINRREMKVARLIVELRDRQNKSWEEIVLVLFEKGYRSRTGLLWNRVRAKRVHKHWTGKL